MNTVSTAIESLEGSLRGKLLACQEALRKLGRVVVAFSAGVDSTFLLAVAAQTLEGRNVLAAVGVSPSLARRELEAARTLAKEIGAELVELETAELDNPQYAANPARRCFFCKSDLFGRLRELARSRGFPAVVSGANADDAGDFRPGLEAGRELGVRNPLMEAGLSKEDIRRASKAMGLPTWNKPAMACLASRIPYGERITAGKLARVEQAEYVLRDLGFGQCRVRDHGEVARIEVPETDLPEVLHRRETIVASLKALGYVFVSMDLQGFRSGAMNEAIGEARKT